MKGTIENGYTLGKVYKNTAFGVYGDLKNKNILKIQSNEEVEVASREEIKIGKAKILCELENGKLIGAVTHVLVNDPTEGYAVFGDILVKQMSIVE